MKKFFYSIIAAATMLFATTSCSQDELINNGDTPQGGKGQKVTFKVEMPAEDAASRSIADGVNVGGGNMADNLIWALYEQGKNNRLDCGHVTGAKNEESNGKHEFTVDITMVKGLTYNILFFAYDADNCVFKLASEPKETDLTALTLVDNLVANNEGYDAFVKCHTYKFGGETTVYLTRPFAQVNAATTEEDLTRANQLEAVVTKSELVIKNVPTQYNVLTGEATANSDLTYSATEILKHYGSGNETHPNEEIVIEEEGVEKTYYYLAMAYVLAGETADSEQSMHNATFNFYRGANGDDPMRTIDILNLPIQRNWRTNVIGALLTEEESFKIVIDHKFKGDHNHFATSVYGSVGDVVTIGEGEDAEKAIIFSITKDKVLAVSVKENSGVRGSTQLNWNAAKTWAESFGPGWRMASLEDMQAIHAVRFALNKTLKADDSNILFEEDDYEDPVNRKYAMYWTSTECVPSTWPEEVYIMRFDLAGTVMGYSKSVPDGLKVRAVYELTSRNVSTTEDFDKAIKEEGVSSIEIDSELSYGSSTTIMIEKDLIINGEDNVINAGGASTLTPSIAVMGEYDVVINELNIEGGYVGA